MIKKLILCIFLSSSIGCATAADLAIQTVAGTIGGAVGNMADRRIEKLLGNDAEEADKKLEPKLKEFTVIDERGKEIK